MVDELAQRRAQQNLEEEPEYTPEEIAAFKQQRDELVAWMNSEEGKRTWDWLQERLKENDYEKLAEYLAGKPIDEIDKPD